jgi:hypothetical protein
MSCSPTGEFQINIFSTNDCTGSKTTSSYTGCFSAGGSSFRSLCAQAAPGAVQNSATNVNITVTFTTPLTGPQIALLQAALLKYTNSSGLVVTVTASVGSPTVVFNIQGTTAGLYANTAVGNTQINPSFFAELEPGLPTTRSATVGNVASLLSASAALFLAVAMFLAML